MPDSPRIWDWYYSDLELDDTKYCSAGDLLYAWSASFGPRIWQGEKCIFHYHIWRVDHDKTQVAKKYLYYWFGWDTEQIKKDLGAGTTMVHVSMKSMNARPIPLPPLPEQHGIVAILDEAFAAIATATANAEKNLANARELFENHADAVFSQRGEGWERRALGELCLKMEYGTASKSRKVGRVPVLRMGNIQSSRIDWDDLVFSDDEAEIAKYGLQHNDVLFNRTNSAEHVGKTAIYKGERPAIFAGYLIRIHRRKELIDADFLNLFLNSRGARAYGKTVMSRSVNQANISGSKLKNYQISLPSVAAQRSIARRLLELSTELQRLESVYQRKHTALATLKQSILHRAFSGELTAQPRQLELDLS